MVIDISEFNSYTQDGITIERDTRVREQLLQFAGERLAEKRRGTELDDHLSDEMHCLRKTVLTRLSSIKKINADLIERPIEKDGFGESQDLSYSVNWDVSYRPEVLIQSVNPQEVIWFGFGHSFQDFIYGDKAEQPVFSDEYGFWYSPDGVDLIGNGDVHEFKTTRKWPSTKAAREAGNSIEKILVDSNPSWFKYMLAVMHLTGERTYYLTVGWISGADLETFKVTATDGAVEDEWIRLEYWRGIKRESIKSFTLDPEVVDGIIQLNNSSLIKEQGKLPDFSTRLGAWECKNCSFNVMEPCVSDIARTDK